MKVQYSTFDKNIVKIFLPFFILRFFFHIRVFYKYLDNLPLEQDLNNELEQYNITLFNRKYSFIKQLYPLCWALAYDPFFLSLFYSRLYKYHQLMRFWKKDNSTFYIQCPLGKNVHLHHPFSTILNAKSIGDNFTVKNNVTIGNKYDDNNCKPTIGDNVYVSSNVVIFGDITIGDNVTIGAGAVVNKDVASNSIVVGNPMRIIHNTTLK